MEQSKKLQIGEWVKGKTKDGEFVYGFIDDYDPSYRIFKVRVMESDNEEIAGQMISIKETNLKRMETTVTYSKQTLLDLIDVALAVKDENWFKELTSQLAMVNKIELGHTKSISVEDKKNEQKSQQNK